MRIIRLALVASVLSFALLTGIERRVRPVEAQSFDVCLEDDGNKTSALRFNSNTGEYTFCAGGSVSSGRGSVRKMGNAVTLEHAAADRRVLGRVDTSSGAGSAMLQTPPGTTRATIRDSNTANSSCGCR